MKLGVAGLLPSDWRQIDHVATQRVREVGFCGAALFIRRPLEAERADVQRVKQTYDDAGLEVAQVNGWYECLVNPDDGLRAEGIRGLQALVQIGRQVNAHTVYVRPGSLNPKGHWWPHPNNHTSATFARLVDSLRHVCKVAETEGMTLAIEGHVLSSLDTPQRVHDLFDAVGSTNLKFNLDPVNFIGTVRDAHDTTRVLNALFDTLGTDIVVGHAKDCALADAFVVRIDEVSPCTGTMNYELFLQRFEQYCPAGYMLVEHLPDDKIPAARAAIVQVAARVGVPLR
jgi:sugar phosphate isomerase/epimerase